MKIDTKRFYRVLAPRPAVLISTVDGKGKVNAAPFSFVMPVSMNPPLLAFSAGHDRDTLANIMETGEFVVNIPPEEILDKLWICSKGFPRGVNELGEAGLTAKESERVKPPHVEECIAWLECKLEFEKDAGDHVIVVGKVLDAGVREGILKENGNLDVKKARALMHLGGTEFAVAERAVNV